MAKKAPKTETPLTAAPAEVAGAASVEAPAVAAAAKTIGVRGLKGIPLTAKITLLAEKNPKRPGCSAEKRFALYATGQTQEEFLNAGGTTPDLAYDSAHGFISVEGYDPKLVVKKERAPKEPKAPKAKKVKAVAAPAETPVAAEVEAEVVAETID